MMDRPIIFSGAMIRALIAGTKTMTRRLAWQKPWVAIQVGDGPLEPIMVPSPWRHVKPGDRLWVRETWAENPYLLSAGQPGLFYRADSPDLPDDGPWRSPIYMRRSVSRLTLTVTAARLEPLQAITEEDALAEGTERDTVANIRKWGYDQTAKMAFADLWDSLHGPGSWEVNPEVVALSFTADLRNIDSSSQDAIERAGR